MMTEWKAWLLAASCMAAACSPARADDPPSELATAPEAVIDTSLPADSLRAEFDAELQGAEFGGVILYAQVSKDFPEEYAAMLDAIVAGVRAGKSDDELGREGLNFSMTLKQKYNDRMKDAGPVKVRALILSAANMLRFIRQERGAQGCDDALAAYNAGTGTLTTGATPEGQVVYAANTLSSWEAMKAGVSAAQPAAPPTTEDFQALAQAAIDQGVFEAVVENWWQGKPTPAGQHCNLAIGMLDAELAMTGAAGERLRAASTLGLPQPKH